MSRPSTSLSERERAIRQRLKDDLAHYAEKCLKIGTKGVGRSSTIQLFHGSEVAFWPFAETHAAGVLQAVPDVEGTEVILESTANGLGNFFHQKWSDADSGIGAFETIFVPWYWQEEYSRPAPSPFVLNDEEEE